MTDKKTPKAVVWSTDIASIPKGEMKTKEIQTKEKLKRHIRVFEPSKLWVVASSDFGSGIETKVLRTYWIKDQNRWCMFEQDSDFTLLAWARFEELSKAECAPVIPEGLVNNVS